MGNRTGGIAKAAVSAFALKKGIPKMSSFLEKRNKQAINEILLFNNKMNSKRSL